MAARTVSSRGPAGERRGGAKRKKENKKRATASPRAAPLPPSPSTASVKWSGVTPPTSSSSIFCGKRTGSWPPSAAGGAAERGGGRWRSALPSASSPPDPARHEKTIWGDDGVGDIGAHGSINPLCSLSLSLYQFFALFSEFPQFLALMYRLHPLPFSSWKARPSRFLPPPSLSLCLFLLLVFFILRRRPGGRRGGAAVCSPAPAGETGSSPIGSTVATGTRRYSRVTRAGPATEISEPCRLLPPVISKPPLSLARKASEEV